MENWTERGEQSVFIEALQCVGAIMFYGFHLAETAAVPWVLILLALTDHRNQRALWCRAITVFAREATIRRLNRELQLRLRGNERPSDSRLPPETRSKTWGLP